MSKGGKMKKKHFLFKFKHSTGLFHCYVNVHKHLQLDPQPIFCKCISSQLCLWHSQKEKVCFWETENFLCIFLTYFSTVVLRIGRHVTRTLFLSLRKNCFCLKLTSRKALGRVAQHQVDRQVSQRVLKPVRPTRFLSEPKESEWGPWRWDLQT